MKTYHKSQLAGLIALVFMTGLLACPNSVWALGFALPDQDAFATARGNAFVATADDPAAVFYNPAGITQLDGKHLSVGAYGIVYGSSYNGPSGGIDSKTQLEVLPQVFSTWQLPYGFTFGLGTYSPYGLREEWPASAPFSTIGEMGEMDYLTLNPVIAYQILPSLSIAAGPTLSYSEVELKQFIHPPFAPVTFNNFFRGRDTAAGYNVGLLWHPLEEHSFGITYRSPTDMNYKGHSTLPMPPFTDTPAAANFHFPQSLVFGYSFRPTTNWNFESDATWTDWSSLRTVTVNPLPEGLAFNYHPSWMLDFGATRYLGSGWRASGGFMYSEDSVPDSTYNPLVPDSDRYIFSLGIGKQYKQFSWDVAYQLAWGPSHNVSSDGFPPANGSYEFLSHAISINFGYHF